MVSEKARSRGSVSETDGQKLQDLSRMNVTTALVDLDELVLLCRDEKARLYIVEAVACYRSGAYRSAIVATWIAVCYDIVDKLRELALSGDKNAEKYIANIERARAANDFHQALMIERDLLNVARDEFELISHLEHIDLLRLQEDRNRCAHPSLISQDQVFNPSGELARLHVRSTVLHLLQHQPVQGKYALERLLNEVHSEYFPDTVQKAVQAFSSGPLRRPRDSLVRNFVLVLLKDVLASTLKWKGRFRRLTALRAVEELHHGVFELTIKEQLSRLFRMVPDSELYWCVWLLVSLPNYWDVLSNDVQLKLGAFVRHLPTEHFGSIGDVMEYKPLRQQAEARVRIASREDIADGLFWDLPLVVGDRCIALYVESRNFAEANTWSSIMRTFATLFTADQQRQILIGIGQNGQLYSSNTVGSVINELRQSKKLSATEFEQLLEKSGIGGFRAS
jgi:hypothetical protein